MFEMETAYAGAMLNINTFNQNSVEQTRNYIYALLGRAGYEGSAESLREKLAVK